MRSCFFSKSVLILLRLSSDGSDRDGLGLDGPGARQAEPSHRAFLRRAGFPVEFYPTLAELSPVTTPAIGTELEAQDWDLKYYRAEVIGLRNNGFPVKVRFLDPLAFGQFGVRTIDTARVASNQIRRLSPTPGEGVYTAFP